MKKFFKLSAVILVICILGTCNAFAAEGLDKIEECTAPSSKFIYLISQVFNEKDNFEVLNNQDQCITEIFTDEYADLFADSDFEKLALIFSRAGYTIQYGTTELKYDANTGGRSTMTVYTPWKYVLTELDQLLSGKMLEFSFRSVGYCNISNNQITSFGVNSVQTAFTFPGSLFPYTYTWSDISYGNINHCTINSRISVTVTYVYSEAYQQTVTVSGSSTVITP